jgi:hypothetical protein
MTNNQHLLLLATSEKLVRKIRHLDTLTDSNAEDQEFTQLLSDAEELESKLKQAVMKWTCRAIESGLDIDSELHYAAESKGWLE